MVRRQAHNLCNLGDSSAPPSTISIAYREVKIMNGNYVVWTIVGVLAIVALLIFIL